MKELARPNVWMFIFLAFGLSWGLMMIPEWIMGYSEFLPLVQALLFSWGPAIAAIVMKKWVFSGSIKGLGWNRKYYDYRWIFLTIFGPLLILATTIGLVYLMGNILNVPGFGRIDIGMMGDWSLYDVVETNGFAFLIEPLIHAYNGEFWTTVVILTGLMLLIGASLGLLMHLGPEMGFRGYLLKELQPLGFLGANTVLGMITGAWQSLMLVNFLPGWSNQFIPIFLTIFGFQLCLAFPAAWFSLRTRSVYASATFISVLTQISGLMMLFLWNSNPYLTGVNGLAGMLILLGATAAIMYWDRRFVDDYEKLVY